MKNIHYTMPPLNLNILEERALLACTFLGTTNDIQFEDGTTALKTVTGACHGEIPAKTEIMAISGVAFDSDHLAGPVYSGKTGSHSELIYWVCKSADEQSFLNSQFLGETPTVPYCEVVIPLKNLTVPAGFCLTQRMDNMVTKEIVIGFPRHILDTTLPISITTTTTIQAEVEIGTARSIEFSDALDADFGQIYAEFVNNKLVIGSENIPFESSSVFSVFARNLCRDSDCMPTTFQKHVEANKARLRDL